MDSLWHFDTTHSTRFSPPKWFKCHGAAVMVIRSLTTFINAIANILLYYFAPRIYSRSLCRSILNMFTKNHSIFYP